MKHWDQVTGPRKSVSEHGNGTPSSCNFTHWLQKLPPLKIRGGQVRDRPPPEQPGRGSTVPGSHCISSFKGHLPMAEIWIYKGVNPSIRHTKVILTIGSAGCCPLCKLAMVRYHQQLNITEMAAQWMDEIRKWKPGGFPPLPTCHPSGNHPPSLEVQQPKFSSSPGCPHCKRRQDSWKQTMCDPSEMLRFSGMAFTAEYTGITTGRPLVPDIQPLFLPPAAIPPMKMS